MEKLHTFDLSYVLVKICFANHGFQNMFVFQARFSTIHFKQKNNEYKVCVLKLKGVI